MAGLKFIVSIFSVVLMAIWIIMGTRDERGQPFERLPLLRIIIGPIMFIAVLTLLTGIVTVNSGYRGVVISFGRVTERVLGEGVHWVTPFVDSVEQVDVQLKKMEVKTEASSKDLQIVHTTMAFNYRLDPGKVNKIYQDLRNDYEVRIIGPALNEATKAAMAQFTAEGLIVQRTLVKSQLLENLKVRLNNYSIMTEDVSFTNFDFSKQFNESIERKVESEQLAQKAKNDLERVKFEAEQKVATAKAEAESLRLQKAEITKDMIELRRVEAEIEAIKKWNGVLPNMIGTGAVPFLNIK